MIDFMLKQIFDTKLMRMPRNYNSIFITLLISKCIFWLNQMIRFNDRFVVMVWSESVNFLVFIFDQEKLLPWAQGIMSEKTEIHRILHRVQNFLKHTLLLYLLISYSLKKCFKICIPRFIDASLNVWMNILLTYNVC